MLAFNPTSQKAEAGGSLSLRPAWSTEQVPGHPSLATEGNHQNQKADEDVIEQVGHVSASAINRTWQRWPCGYDFRVKYRRKGSWDLP
jgi:hypothetical protein